MEDSFAKPFKSADEQLAILSQRGLDVPDRQRAVQILQRYGYYRLINGYHKPFEKNIDEYLSNQTIDNILALYRFDEALKDFCFKYCLKIEVMLKSAIANSFAAKYTSIGCWDRNNFESESDEFSKMFEAINVIKFEAQNTLNRINKIEYDKTKNASIKNEALLHYMDVYNNIPIWVLMNALTFGVVGKFTIV